MPDVVQFVDSISATPTVRLDLNDDQVWSLKYEGTDFTPPPLRRAVAQTLLADGGRVTAAAYDNRLLRLRLELKDTTVDAVASRTQELMRELDRPTNILKWQPGTTEPVFFRTMRSDTNRVTEVPGTGTFKLFDVDVLAEPFAYGLKETLPQTTVYQDPANPGPDLNANPYFETDTADWSAVGGTIARSTAQAHEGVASLLLTPDGVTATVEAQATPLAVSAGVAYQASAWVRCAVTRTVNVGLNWRRANNSLISAPRVGVGVAANTWTLIEAAFTAPADAATATLVAGNMTGTPPASNTVFIDEARLRQVGGGNACYFDVSGIRGDVETPLFLRLEQGSITDQRRSVIGVRRRGNPAAMPLAVQAETMTLGADATLGVSTDAAMSGTGQNYARVNFATLAGAVRVAAVNWPPAGTDVRGTYRVFPRVRVSVPADVMSLWFELAPAGGGNQVVGDKVTPPLSTAPRYIDLGLIQLPIGADPVTDGYSGVPLAVGAAQNLSVGVQRVSGTGTLDIDNILLVPADDRLCIVDWPVDATLTALVLDSARASVYAVGPSGEVRATQAVPLVGGPPLVSPNVSNRIVFVQDTGERQSGVANRLTSTTLVTPYYWPKYLYVRGVGS
ncbi:carbohydrate binding domain-containing protein [Micromonospora sp. CB01531]|uniref:carbohydrate binding domain-containing protein n=1 Tax=Micromonospora sp. CB01531 TaxID=1718947 RepID=UPI00093C61BE|nr:carbohydrate binding domain-containing protein [Micromonospora sp. CB01531]OKI47311.1 hypothetical protein A6A27_10715 [Micromonospora sp. CB01531]